MTAINRATLDLMLRQGSGFERALAKAAIEADTWNGYACALIQAYNCADAANKGMIEAAYRDLWALEATSEAERLGLLHDLFGFDVFDRFAELAQREREAKA